MADQPRHSRQFSLRTVFAVIAILGVVLSPWTREALPWSLLMFCGSLGGAIGWKLGGRSVAFGALGGGVFATVFFGAWGIIYAMFVPTPPASMFFGVEGVIIGVCLLAGIGMVFGPPIGVVTAAALTTWCPEPESQDSDPRKPTD